MSKLYKKLFVELNNFIDCMDYFVSFICIKTNYIYENFFMRKKLLHS